MMEQNVQWNLQTLHHMSMWSEVEVHTECFYEGRSCSSNFIVQIDGGTCDIFFLEHRNTSQNLLLLSYIRNEKICKIILVHVLFQKIMDALFLRTAQTCKGRNPWHRPVELGLR
jgi:hypothetical protein